MQSQSYQILLIGEHSSRTQAYGQMLQDGEDAFFEVQRKTNWQSALTRFVSCAPDLLLPHAILWIRPHTRVLYMSGYPNQGMVQAGILANGVALLEKPFTRESLSKRVRQVLDEPAVAT